MKLMVWLMPDIATPGRRPAYHHRSGTLARTSFDVVVDPELAGWSYTGLRVITLAPDVPFAWSTGTREVAVLPLRGSCRVDWPDGSVELAGRESVFSAVSDFLYVPRDTEIVVLSRGGAQIAVPSAESTRRLEVAYCPADAVSVETRGSGQSTRQINNFLNPEAPVTADKLVAVEVLTPAGNWSSYPPHKHDELREGEAVLEEIYYFAFDAPGRPASVADAFGLHRVYTDDGSIDLTVPVADGDVVLVPRGYHGPSVAAPGYDMYYLNVLAGPGQVRTMACLDDPAHHWIRQAWQSERPDERVPMTTAPGPRGAAQKGNS